MNRTNIMLLLVAIFVLGIFGTTLYYTQYSLIEVHQVPVDVEIASHNIHGINAEPTALNFSTVPVTGLAYRWLTIHNTHDFPIRVVIDIPPSLEEIVFVDFDTFQLEPGQSVKLTFTAYGNPNKERIRYVDFVKVSIYRA